MGQTVETMLARMPVSELNTWLARYEEIGTPQERCIWQHAELCYWIFKTSSPKSNVKVEDFLPQSPEDTAEKERKKQEYIQRIKGKK